MKKKKKPRSIWYLFGGLSVISASLGLYVMISLTPVQSTSDEFVLIVESGDTVRSVTEYLKENDVIRNDTIAYFYVRYAKLTSIKTGTYRLDKSWDIKKIFTLLNDPKGSESTDIKITFPEGLWAKEIAARIEEVTNVSSSELLALWNDEAYITSLMTKYSFITEEVLNERLKVKLEGYLFPETYYFYEISTAQGITEKLLDQTNKVFMKYENEFNNSDYSIHQLFTLASITQFESGKNSDNKTISGIWFNRLDNGMLLQSSVTVCYALYDYDHWRACEVNPNLDSPYNTYLYSGIPIGPINNPGESAIVSVLYPTDTDYYYFIADVYGDGTVYYAVTYGQHLANIDKYLKQ